MRRQLFNDFMQGSHPLNTAGQASSGTRQSNDRTQRIGLLAAWRRFPVLVAEALRRQDYHVSCLAVADLADPRLREICQDFHWVGWGKLGGALKFFRRCGIREATMAGKFHKVLLY